MTTFKLSYGRNDWTRTSGPMIPNHVRYQTALHPETHITIFQIANKFYYMPPPMSRESCYFFNFF